ncbi:MAG: preprotein translocase subunit SecE [Clostridia bacterium]
MGEVAKKEGLITRVKKGFKATKSELKKVVWPTKTQLINNTGIVIAAIVVIGLVIFGLDSLFTTLASLILG